MATRTKKAASKRASRDGTSARAAEQVELRFRPDGASRGVAAELSAVTCIGDDVWLAADEGSTIERLTPGEDGHYAGHERFALRDLVELPGEPDEEVDVEGMEYRDGYLWVVGSHSLKRGKPDPEQKKSRKQLAGLAEVRADGNRYLLARIPLVMGDAGRGARLVRRVTDDDGRVRQAARLVGGRHGNALLDALRFDEHLGPFVHIPGKENGLDIEGLAVGDERILLGLRGPVLRGWAVVLGVAPAPEPDAPGLLRLRPVQKGGRVVDKHFLDLRGLGVRELARDGDDVLILAGPTMALDGDAAVFRWRKGARATGDSLVGRDALERVAVLPYGRGEREDVDHPEGIARLPGRRGRPLLLVVYDAPAPARLVGKGGVKADVVVMR